jgi:hypothetical protein
MNRGKKLKQMCRFINKYGIIDQEYKRPPDKNYPPYRKGSYFAVFLSDKLDLSACVGDVDKYQVYKEIVREIKDRIKE